MFLCPTKEDMKTLIEILTELTGVYEIEGKNHYQADEEDLQKLYDDYCKQFEPVGEVYLELNTDTGGYNTFTTLFIDLPDKTKLFTTPQQIPSEVEAYIERLDYTLHLLRDNQNGCPLPSYQENWHEAMRLSLIALASKPDCLKD